MSQSKILAVLLLIAHISYCSEGFSEINTTLRIRRFKDLVFSDAYAGDSNQTVLPSDPGASEFEITGSPNSAIELFIPDNNSNLRRLSQLIPVHSWSVSVPLKTQLGPTGRLIIKLGATRDQIPNHFSSGNYIGTHRVRARYIKASNWIEQTAQHKMKLSKRITANKIADLLFFDSYAGSPSDTIQLTHKNNTALFDISGDPQQTVLVTLPSPKTVFMRSAQPNKPIGISRFNSIPIGFFRLNSFGKARVTVGATREAISVDQPAGVYEASFVIRVTYF